MKHFGQKPRGPHRPLPRVLARIMLIDFNKDGTWLVIGRDHQTETIRVRVENPPTEEREWLGFLECNGLEIELRGDMVFMGARESPWAQMVNDSSLTLCGKITS